MHAHPSISSFPFILVFTTNKNYHFALFLFTYCLIEQWLLIEINQGSDTMSQILSVTIFVNKVLLP